LGRKGIGDEEDKEYTETGNGQELLAFDSGAEKEKKKEEEISQDDRQRRGGDAIGKERDWVKKMRRSEKEAYQ
jgi:hypothetical protein